MYANKLKALQTEKKDHQNQIVNFEYTLEVYTQKNTICNYVILGILGLIFILFFSNVVEQMESKIISPLGMVFLISLIIVICIKRRFKRKKKQTQDSKKAFTMLHGDAINEIDEQLHELIEEMFDKNLFDIIPPSYFYPSAIEYIISVFNRRLADDMKEAFHLLEAEIQRIQAMRSQSEFNESLIGEVKKLTNAVNLNTYLTSKKE